MGENIPLFLFSLLQSNDTSSDNSTTTNSTSSSTTISTETFLLAKGFSTTLDVLLLVFALIMSILIPTLYYYNVVLGRKRRESDDEAIKNQKTGQCGCYPHHWKNFIFSLPMNSNNSLHLMNDRGSFALFQSTWFHIVIFRLARLCSCCGIRKKSARSAKEATYSATQTNVDDTLSTTHEEIEDKKIQRKHIRLYNISCWISTVWILLLRICLLGLAVVVSYYVADSETSRGTNWLTYTQYLTNNSFNVFVVYSFFITISHIAFLVMTSILACKAEEDSLFPYLSTMPLWLTRTISLYGNALWILAELNLVTETVVSLGYWAILVPTSSISASKLVTLVNLTTHLFCWVASMIENLNSDFYLKFWHIFLVGIFCPCYLLFVIALRETNIITSMPYGAILDYYKGTFAIIFHVVFTLAYYVFFTFYWTISTVIKKQLVVFLSDPVIKKTASKSEFMQHIGLGNVKDQASTHQNNSFDNL